MGSLLRSILWPAVNGPGLIDELHFAVALGSGISADFLAQPRCSELGNLQRVLAETDARHREHNRFSLASLILIRDNKDGWLQKADVWVNKDMFARIEDQLPSILWVHLPIHGDTINVKVLKDG